MVELTDVARRRSLLIAALAVWASMDSSSARLGGVGTASVGSGLDVLVDGPNFIERALDVGDGVPEVLPLLPDLGKDFVKRRPISTPIAGHAGGFGKRRASTHLTNVEPGTWRATFSGHPMMSAEGFGAAPTPWGAVQEARRGSC